MVASEMIEQKLKVNTSWSISVKTDQRKFQETIIITIIVITIITIEIRNIFNRLTCIQRRQCRSSGYSYTVLSHRLPSLQIYFIKHHMMCVIQYWIFYSGNWHQCYLSCPGPSQTTLRSCKGLARSADGTTWWQISSNSWNVQQLLLLLILLKLISNSVELIPSKI